MGIVGRRNEIFVRVTKSSTSPGLKSKTTESIKRERSIIKTEGVL